MTQTCLAYLRGGPFAGLVLPVREDVAQPGTLARVERSGREVRLRPVDGPPEGHSAKQAIYAVQYVHEHTAVLTHQGAGTGPG